MQEQRAKKWFRVFIIGQLGVLFGIAGLMAAVDPYFHYHAPLPGLSYRLYEERYINDGISRNFEYDAMITGTSMTQNFKTSEFDRLFGVRSVKEPFSGGGFQEIGENLSRALSYNSGLKTVLLCLDYNGFNREYDWKQYDSYPDYLYDRNPFNDVSYVLNKSILYSGLLNNLYLTAAGQPSTTFDEYSAWSSAYGFDSIMRSYERSEEVLPMKDGLTPEERERVEKNIRLNILPVIEEHPDTEFLIFYPPYSILFWDSLYREGRIKEQLEAENMVNQMLLPYENVKLYCFTENTELICDLDNYRDKEHYTAQINSYILQEISRDNYRLTLENERKHMEKTAEFYLRFDYDAFFEQAQEQNTQE